MPTGEDRLENRYRIERKLGEGGMGAVYLALDETLQQYVAIKTLLPAIGQDPRAVEKLKREVRTAQKLRHENICATYDFRDGSGTPFVVMEYVDGETLSGFLHRQPGGRCDEATFWRLAEQILLAVEYAHKAGVVHRDLKPSNIQVKPDGGIRLMDFGIAASLKEVSSEVTGSTITLSIRYAAPEQINGGVPSPSMDIYALGCVFYEMLSGEPPFSRGDILHQHLTRLPGAIPGISALLNKGLLWCLEKDPDRRCRDLAMLRTGWASAQGQFGVSDPDKTVVLDRFEDRDMTIRLERDRPVRVDGEGVRGWQSGMDVASSSSRGDAGESTGVLAEPTTPNGPVAPPSLQINTSAGRKVAWWQLLQLLIAALGLLYLGNSAWKLTHGGKNFFDDKGLIESGGENDEGLIESGGKNREWRDGIVQQWIPPGRFRIGCSVGDRDCDGDEFRTAEIRINSGFWMQQSEVTQGAYERAMGSNPSYFKGDSLPVERVSWFEARMYCEQVGLRLPTELEWEYAARGGIARARYGDVDLIAWHRGNSGNHTHVVKEKEPNVYGLYDMLGNVWEWTDSDYNAKTKTLRGGSWNLEVQYARASGRDRLEPGGRADWFVGFRCVGD